MATSQSSSESPAMEYRVSAPPAAIQTPLPSAGASRASAVMRAPVVRRAASPSSTTSSVPAATQTRVWDAARPKERTRTV